MQIFMNIDGGGRGGPQVWSNRFRRVLEQRGYRIALNLADDWLAALFVIGVEGMEKALEYGKPIGYRVANGYLPRWFETMGREMQPEHHAVNAAIARALELADAVIYQSRWAKQQLDALLYHRTDRYAVIYNGVDLTRFCPPDQRPPGVPVIGTVGVLRYRYRLETFLGMSRQLDLPHRLLIVGSMDAECAEVLHRYQADPLVGPRITYQPYVPPDELPALYQQMSLLVHPVCGDVCPNVVVEALACGVPVVAPRFGGTAELVGEAGVIFDCLPWVYDEGFTKAMALAATQALSHVDRCSPLARQRAEQDMDMDRMVDGYLQVLGLPTQVTPSRSASIGWKRQLRQLGARWIARPRFYAAVALRKARQAQRRFFPPAPNAKPRIAFTLYDFHVGGIENWLYRLARELRGEFDFYFLSTRVADILPKFRDVGVCAYLPSPAKMVAYLQKQKIDIVQVHNERWPIDAALAAGVPHIIERTDGTRSCIRVPKQGLTMVIASSQGTVPLIARHFPKERIRLIYNGVDLEEVDVTQVVRPWPPEMFVIGRTSRFGRGKNLDMLIEAVRRLRARCPELKLVFIGGDSLMPGAERIESELRALAASLGEAVEFLGVKENTLPWVKGFDVGTCVSDPDNEGVPNSLIEAMACRKPVISTDVDQVSELVEHNVNGLLIPPGDVDALCEAIEQLFNDRALGHRLGEAGRRTVEQRFSLKSAAAQYGEIYRMLLGL